MEYARGYFEVAPKKFLEKKYKLPALVKGQLLLAPKLVGICGSDAGWFVGDEAPAKLKSRLPMALLHEGIAKVLATGEGSQFAPGDLVVVHPLIPGKRVFDVTENYQPESRFMASNANGLAREAFVYPSNRVVAKPENLPERISALTEPLSIAFRTIKEGRLDSNDKVAVIGDGMMGHFIALMLAKTAKIKKENLFLIGINSDKLRPARKIATLINSKKSKDRKALEERLETFDAVFEAVGGAWQSATLAQALLIVRPRGKVVVVGISNALVEVNIHSLVAKGVKMIGSSRSTIGDFRATLKVLASKPIQDHLEQFIHEKRFSIKSARDLERAFGYFLSRRPDGKLLLTFDWTKAKQ